MAYCAHADVSAQLKRLTLSGTSAPTTTEVGTYADLISADMDSRMQAVGITVPVTDATKLNVLKPIAVNGVIAMILRAVQSVAENAAEYQRLYDEAMDRIMAAPAIIQNTQSSGAYPTGSTAQETRPFRRDEQDW